jgi:NADH:ubiquinone reductase (H+-translocating)
VVRSDLVDVADREHARSHVSAEPTADPSTEPTSDADEGRDGTRGGDPEVDRRPPTRADDEVRLAADLGNDPGSKGRRTHRVVVVGGGFGGLNVTRELARSEVAGELDVTLVDKRNHHTFQPLLYQVATAGLQPHDIGMSLRSIGGLRRTGPDGRPTTQIRLGEVVEVDDEAVVLADGARLPYDHVVIAAGGITNDLGIPGVAEHAFGLKSLAEASQLRNHLLRRFEAAASDPEHLTDGTLTFVIAGGGPTGVELAGALAELTKQVMKEDFPTIDRTNVRIVLLELTDRLLPGFSDRSHRIAVQSLRERGVDVRLETGAEEVTAEAITLDDGEVLPTRTLIWATGIAGVPLGAQLGVEPGKAGRIDVDPWLRATDDDGVARDGRVFVIGDLAGSIGGGDALPQVAPVAIQQGRFVADVITRQVAGEDAPGSVPLPRQGEDGDHRPHRRGGRAALRAEVPRLPGVDHLAGAAPAVAGRVPQPGLGAPQLVVELPHLRPRQPGAGRPARGRGGRHLQGSGAPLVGGPPGGGAATAREGRRHLTQPPPLLPAAGIVSWDRGGTCRSWSATRCTIASLTPARPGRAAARTARGRRPRVRGCRAAWLASVADLHLAAHGPHDHRRALRRPGRRARAARRRLPRGACPR